MSGLPTIETSTGGFGNFIGFKGSYQTIFQLGHAISEGIDFAINAGNLSRFCFHHRGRSQIVSNLRLFLCKSASSFKVLRQTMAFFKHCFGYCAICQRIKIESGNLITGLLIGICFIERLSKLVSEGSNRLIRALLHISERSLLLTLKVGGYEMFGHLLFYGMPRPVHFRSKNSLKGPSLVSIITAF
jgi:hypothetical protein